MKVLLTGATGFVGGHLAKQLEESEHTVTAVSRSTGAGIDWSEPGLERAVAEADAVIHLAGESIFGKRWSPAQKERIHASRVDTTRTLAQHLARRGSGVLIHASAVGYYGPRGPESIDESAPSGDDFLAGVCRDLEAASASAKQAGVRVAAVRIGVVLGADGGALKLMRRPFEFGFGGPVGNGRQVFPWIHVEDLARLFLFLLENEDASGPYNGTAPGTLTSAEFAKTYGKVLGRPAFLPLPGIALRIALGEVADVLLTGQRAEPKRALEAGFEFRFPELEGALRDLSR